MRRMILAFALLVPFAAVAEEKAGLGLETSLKAGVLAPFAKVGVSPSVALEATYALPVLDEALLAGLELRFGRPTREGTLSNPAVQGGTAFAYSFDLTTLTLALPVAYRYDAGPWAARGGVAPALVLAAANVKAFDLENRQTDTRFGVDLFGAFDYRLGPGAITGELRFTYATVDFLATGSAALPGMALAAGYRYSF